MEPWAKSVGGLFERVSGDEYVSRSLSLAAFSMERKLVLAAFNGQTLCHRSLHRPPLLRLARRYRTGRDGMLDPEQPEPARVVK